MLWLLVNGTQHVVFVDPKGLRNVPKDDPKVQFYESVKGIEKRLGDPSTRLHAFLISQTASSDIQFLWGLDKNALRERNILFQAEDQDTYVGDLLRRLLDGSPAS